MALIKCPECGKEISDQAEVCIHCGYKINGNDLSEQVNNENTEQKDNVNAGQANYANAGQANYANAEQANYANAEQANYANAEQANYANVECTNNMRTEEKLQVNKLFTPIRIGMLVVMVVFIIMAGVFFNKGNDAKNNYYYSESYPTLNQNAYVGGDAYNYIINGTYFTGYYVLATGSMICAVICGVGVVIAIDKTQEMTI